jgi:cytochrome oxidase Cu insertion factor (SCO1/SenC/PrrC family)
MTDDGGGAQGRRAMQARNQLLTIFAIALVTLGGAYALFYAAREGGIWGTTNHGTFVDPPLSMAELRLTDADGRVLTEGGTWWLWVVAPAGCAQACESAVQQLRQLHVLLNKDAPRVRRALLAPPGTAAAVMAGFPKLIRLTGDLAPLEQGVYIVDPIGNLVLHYPYRDAGPPVLDDLRRLLKLSQIG